MRERFESIKSQILRERERENEFWEDVDGRRNIREREGGRDNVGVTENSFREKIPKAEEKRRERPNSATHIHLHVAFS